jgi:hypothetical protein
MYLIHDRIRDGSSANYLDAFSSQKIPAGKKQQKVMQKNIVKSKNTGNSEEPDKYRTRRFKR